MLGREISESQKEKIIDSLVDKKRARNTNEIQDESLSFGDRLADKLAGVAGSWPFIVGFLILMAIWVGLNVTNIIVPFDRYPFILLNLALSFTAALQAPVIMMSQNRHEEKDRIKSQQDFDTNEKAEIIIEEILRHTQKIEQIEKRQTEILEYLKNKIN